MKKINIKNNNYFKNFVKIITKKMINNGFNRNFKRNINTMFEIKYNIYMKNRFNNYKIFKNMKFINVRGRYLYSTPGYISSR